MGMKENDVTQKSITDPESRLMKNNGKLDVCYNVQTAVDSKSHLIADFTVTNNCNDMGLLSVCYSTRKVRITFVPDKNKLRLLKSIVEHPFGTIKRWCDGTYLLLKGKVKTTAELSLSFLAYNMKRAINMVGVTALITKIRTL
jgi:hypothetical protein